MKRLLPVVLLIAGAALVPLAPAQAAACSGSSGVTVVVDFDDGRVEVRCAAGDPSSGYDALKRAGFTVTLATGSGAGALCSIDHVPDHPCTSMPPTSAYWAYFHAKPGGAWSYSDLGGGAYNPKPGSVEGWHYRGSESDPPGVAPPGAASTPKPTPSTAASTPRPSSAPRPPAGSTASHAQSGGAGSTPGAVGTSTAASSGTASGGPSATPPSTGTGTATVEGPSAGASATAGSGGSAIEAPTSSRSADDSSGGSSWIWGVVLVLVLAAAAGTTAIRRRRG